MTLAGIYLFNVKNENTRTICEICSNLTIETPGRRQFDFLISLMTSDKFKTLS